MTTFLEETPFNPDDPNYTVEISEDGLVVYSECCLDTMSLQTAERVHEALGQWITVSRARA